MIPVFFDDKIWRVFKAELISWVGTPYRHLQDAKGRGADCALYIARVLKSTGLLVDVVYDYYPKDWHIHTNEEFVLESFNRHIREHLVDGVGAIPLSKDDDLIRGDVLTFSTTKQNVSNHCAVVLDDYNGRLRRIIHSINNRGVSFFPLGKRWRNRQRSGFRFVRI
jgi:hypothetical protein